VSESDQHRRTSADGPARVDVLGVGVSCLTLDSAVEEVSGWVDRHEHQYVCVTGVHGVMECQRDPQLLRIHNRSGLTTPDGMPMVWSARWAGRREVSRVYGPDLMLATLARAVERGWSSFFYGGGPGTAELLADRLTTRFPGLQVAGTATPPFRPLTPPEDAAAVQLINDSGAQLVWVGLSTPKQERWMAGHVGSLRANVLFGVGAAFDLVAGTVPQAPPWMQRSGLEWVYRLAREPRRLWRRYLRNNPAFVLKVLAHPPRQAQPPGSGMTSGSGTVMTERASGSTARRPRTARELASLTSTRRPAKQAESSEAER
jgi:N-acetylglucosaminyldiphosphoundecaprenol N-acetyl-beta-D-mannosaminyltransferase